MTVVGRKVGQVLISIYMKNIVSVEDISRQKASGGHANEYYR